ncbi:MAG TPA: winged helix-turn-helix domain-containing protein, partial [Acidobacteriaceae bacterium]|nr:winged helix-turn-helix domain-containing protein [Acidobacteriaceae bacterium]
MPQRTAPTDGTPTQAMQPSVTPTPLDVYSFAGKTIDFSLLELRTATRHIHLTLMETELLRYLVQNSGRAISRKEILDQVWHLREDTDTRAIDNFI